MAPASLSPIVTLGAVFIPRQSVNGDRVGGNSLQNHCIRTHLSSIENCFPGFSFGPELEM